MKRLARRVGLLVKSGAQSTFSLLCPWASISKTIGRFSPDKISMMSEREARNAATRIVWENARQLQSPLKRTDQVSLHQILATAHLKAGEIDAALASEETAHNGLNTLLPNLEPKLSYTLRRRAASTELLLAKFLYDKGNYHSALQLTVRAVNSHTLTGTQWQRALNGLMKSNFDTDDEFNAFIEVLLHLRNTGDLQVHTAITRLKDGLQAAVDCSHMESQRPLCRLRTLQIAAPWLHWPGILLAEIDLRNHRFSPARKKLSVLFPQSEGPNKTQAAFLFGQVSFHESDFRQANKYFDVAVEGGADVAAVQEFIGLSKASLFEFETALGHINKAIKSSPDDVYLQSQHAKLLMCTGNIGEARKSFKSILTLDPENADAQYGLAKCHEIDGHVGDAEKYYRRILIYDKNHADARFALAAIAIERGDLGEGKKKLEQLRKLVPNHLPTQEELGILCIQNGLISEDRSTLEIGIDQLIKMDATGRLSDRGIYILGKAFSATGFFEDCLRYWDRLSTDIRSSADFKQKLFRTRHQAALNTAAKGKLLDSISSLETLAEDPAAPYEITRQIVQIRLRNAQIAIAENDVSSVGDHVEKVLLLDPGNAKAAFLKVSANIIENRFSRQHLDATIQEIGDPQERSFCIALRDLHNLKLGLPGSNNYAWSSNANIPLPDCVVALPEFQFLNLFDSMMNSNITTPVEAKDALNQILSGIGKINPGIYLAPDELAWWLAKTSLSFLQEEIPIDTIEETLDGADSPCLRLSQGLIQIGQNKLHQGIINIQTALISIQPENPIMIDYLARTHCHIAHKAITGIKKDPSRIHDAVSHLQTAIQHWDRVA